MLMDFFKKHKTKTLLIAAGFLVIAFAVTAVAWVYFSFLTAHNDFFDRAPAEAALFWHRGAGQEADEAWLHEISGGVLTGEAGNQARFLFETVAPESKETAFAILPGFEDFIFWGRLDPSDIDPVKNKLAEASFNYIAEEDGEIIITNTKFALKEVLATLSRKNFSLADERGRLAAWNRAGRSFPAQIYLGPNFQMGDFPGLSLKSDFWGTNILNVAKSEGGYAHILVTDNNYLAKEAGNLLKNTLAVLLPESVDRELPDGTTVKEIVANPDVFIFTKEKISGREADYLSVPMLNREFFLSSADGKTVLADSRDLLANFLVRLGRKPDYYGENIMELAKSGAKWFTSDFGGIVFGVNPHTKE